MSDRSEEEREEFEDDVSRRELKNLDDEDERHELSKPVELEIKNKRGETVRVKASKVLHTWNGFEFTDFNKKVFIEGGTLGSHTIAGPEAINTLLENGIPRREVEAIIDG